MKKLLVLALTLPFVWVSCTDVFDEVKETYHSAEDHTLAEKEVFATFDIVEDVVSTDGLLKKKGGTILPSKAIVTYEDSSFDDGDGVSFTIDFGPLGSDIPKGLLCLDGKYRAGKIHIDIDGRYSEIGTEAMAISELSDNFFTGDGLNMAHLSSKIKAKRESADEVSIMITDGIVKRDSIELTWEAERRVRLIEDNGPGVWRDKYEVTGSAKGTNRNQENYTVEIDEPLVKLIDPECAGTFIKGVLTLRVEESNKTIILDYDPYDNEACDRLAEADINGHKQVFTIE